MSSPTRITNSRGQVIGYVNEQGSQTVYQTPNGRVVARYIHSGDYTLNENGTKVGNGDLGMLVLGEY
jgi:hypothetical protein